MVQLVRLKSNKQLNTKLRDRKRRTAWFAFLVVHEITDLRIKGLKGKTEANQGQLVPTSPNHHSGYCSLPLQGSSQSLGDRTVPIRTSPNVGLR